MSIQVPPPRDVIQRMIIQWGCILVMGLLFGYFHFIAHFTAQRGFYCDDEYLKHPYKEETVPMMMAFAIWVFAVLATVIPTEILVYKTRSDKGCQSHTIKLCGVYIHCLALELYRVFGYFIVGGSFCMLFTDISKNTIGRLRPHFLTICDPWNNEMGLNCTKEKDGQTYWQYIGDGLKDEEICGSLSSGSLSMDYKNATLTKMLKEARLSFMSGHSSFSFFCAVFLIIYLQIRVPSIYLEKTKRSVRKVISLLMRHTRLFWQFGLGILAFWISMTRVADYFHHPMDVVTGCLVGIISASLTVHISGLNRKEYVFSSEDPPKGPKVQAEATVEEEVV